MNLIRQASDLYSRGLFAQALAVATNGAAIDQANAGGLYAIAAASAQALGDLPQAERFWRQAIRIEPTSADLNFNLGVLLASSGREEEAEDCFRRAVES